MPGKFDLQSFLQDTMGAKVVGAGDEPNTVKVQTVDVSTGRFAPKTETLDINAIRKDVGVPAEIDVQINDKDAAIDDAPMGFLDRIQYEVARKPSDKARFLKEKYGKENVYFEPETKSFKVNDRGAWHNADATGLSGFLGGEGDVIAGSIAGGAYGSALGPVGTVVGAGVGAAVARFGTMEAAKAAGLRSEEEASEVMKELGSEFLLGMGGEVLGLGLKGGVAFVKSARNSMKNMAAKAVTPESKRVIAQTLEQATGVKAVDNMTWLEAPSEVAEKQKRLINWEAAGEKGINPVKQEMADSIQETVMQARNKMYKDYETVFKPLQEITKDVKVDVAPLVQNIGSELKAMGLIDDNLEWIPKEAARLQSTVNTADVKRIKQTYDILRRAIGEVQPPAKGPISTSNISKVEDTVLDMYGTAEKRTGNVNNVTNSLGGTTPGMTVDQATLKQGSKRNPNVSFDDALTLKRNFDEILEAAGMYNKGSAEITSATKARISGFRNQLKDTIQKALSEKNPKAGELYSTMNQKFSARREWIDDVASGVSDEKIDATMKRLLGPDGDRSRERMIEALTGSGVNADIFMNTLYQGQAALNTSKLYRKGSSGLGSVVSGAMKMTSPSRTTPLAAKTFAKLKNFAEASEFVKSLPKGQREELIRNPQMLRGLSQITTKAIGIESMLPDALTQRALEQSQPVPLPPQTEEE